MLLRLFLLFTIIPVLELWLLITLGRTLGVLPTVALVIATGATGAWLAKREGRRVLDGWRSALAQGRAPDEGILEGALVLLGGVLLLTPGVVTDVTGLLLFVRPIRRVVAAWARRKLEAGIARGTIRVQTFGGFGGPPPGGPRGDATGRGVGSEDVPEDRPGGSEPPSKLLH